MIYLPVANGASSYETKRQVALAPATGVAETPSELLMRLKLLNYQEKLRAKEAKKKAKAEKKARKQAAFNAYMNAMAAGALNPASTSLTPGVVSGGEMAPGSPSAAAAAPPMPMFPSMGLWKKSFVLSQIMAAAAARNAAIAAAAAGTTTPAPAESGETSEEDEADEEDQTINEIVKRYAPMLRRKFYGAPEHDHEYSEEFEDADDASSDEDEMKELDDDDDDDETASSQSGAFNKFGTGPAGSPNGVGYEDAKVNQAGCSGSHIHICSGTTVYLTNPEDSTNENPASEFQAVESESEETNDTPQPVTQRVRKKISSTMGNI